MGALVGPLLFVKDVFVCVCLCELICTTCVQMPLEARGHRIPAAGVTSSCEPSSIPRASALVVSTLMSALPPDSHCGALTGLSSHIYACLLPLPGVTGLCHYARLWWGLWIGSLSFDRDLPGVRPWGVEEPVPFLCPCPHYGSSTGVGPGCTDETLLSAIASALHTSTLPITGQLSAAVEKNPGVWLNTTQPLCKAFMVTDDDIR